MKKQQNSARPALGRVFLSWMAEVKLPGLKAHIVFWSITAAGIALDLWSKSAVFGWLQQQPHYRFSIIDGFLHFERALNPGAAFGIASGQRCFLVTISVIALIAGFVIFLSSGNERKLFYVGLGFFAAGICGNLYDRIFNDGFVRDFIDVVYWPGRHWPAFNVGDSMLCVGVGLMIICFLTGKSSRKRAQQHK